MPKDPRSSLASFASLLLPLLRHHIILLCRAVIAWLLLIHFSLGLEAGAAPSKQVCVLLNLVGEKRHMVTSQTPLHVRTPGIF